jgi:hypothetical protein
MAQDRPITSCLVFTIIKKYEAMTGIRSKNATFRTGSFKLPVNKSLTIYLTRIIVIGTISAKKAIK